MVMASAEATVSVSGGFFQLWHLWTPCNALGGFTSVMTISDDPPTATLDVYSCQGEAPLLLMTTGAGKPTVSEQTSVTKQKVCG
jgi:hypothetical protein